MQYRSTTPKWNLKREIFMLEILTLIATILIAYSQYAQSERFKKIESENSKRDWNISLFDKRYEIYDLFTNFYTTCSDMLEKFNTEDCEFDEGEKKEVLRSAILSDYSNIDGILAEKESELGEESDSKKRNLYQRYLIFSEKFARDSLTKLKMSKFCYSEEISDVIIRFAEILLNESSIESSEIDETGQEIENMQLARKFFSKVKSVLKEIESKNILEAMEYEIEI